MIILLLRIILGKFLSYIPWPWLCPWLTRMCGNESEGKGSLPWWVRGSRVTAINPLSALMYVAEVLRYWKTNSGSDTKFQSLSISIRWCKERNADNGVELGLTDTHQFSPVTTTEKHIYGFPDHGLLINGEKQREIPRWTHFRILPTQDT